MLFDYKDFESGHRSPDTNAARSHHQALWRRWRVTWALGALGLGAAAWWIAALTMPAESVVDVPLVKMHVAEVMPTDASFGEPTRSISGGVAYWRVAIHDADEHPVPGVLVQVDVVAADGAVHARPVTTTNADGLALFRYVLPEADTSHVYTVRVVNVFHIDRREAVYDRTANTAWSSSFSVNEPTSSHPQRSVSGSGALKDP
jgi:hypothetical protein